MDERVLRERPRRRSGVSPAGPGSPRHRDSHQTPTPRNFLSLFSHSSYWAEPSIEKLREPAEKSRSVLTDLIKLDVDSDTFLLLEVADLLSRGDVVWRGASPAQSATREGLAHLDGQRRAAFGVERRAITWAATIEVLGGVDGGDGAAFLLFVEGIRGEHEESCVAVAAYGEIALYRLAGGELYGSEYRMLELISQDGLRRCRRVTPDCMWPGAVELRDLEAARSWVDEFLTAEMGGSDHPVDAMPGSG